MTRATVGTALWRRRRPRSTPAIDYAALMPLLVVLGAACLARAGRGVPAAPPALARPGHAVASWRLGRGRPRARASTPATQPPQGITTLSDALAVDRPDAVPVGHAARPRARQRAAHRRPLGRAGRGVRRLGGGPGGDRRPGIGPTTDDEDRGYGSPGQAPTMQTEVFPFTLFALGRDDDLRRGQRPADDVRRAGGAQPAAVPDVRARPAPPAAVAGGGGQVLPARRVRVGVLPLRPGAALRLRGLGQAAPTSPTAAAGSQQSDTLLFGGLALLVVGLLFKASVGPFHTWTPDVYQGAPTPVTAFMAACTKVAAFGGDPAGAARGVRRHPLGVARRAVGRRDRLDGDRRGARPHADRRQADGRLLVRRARRLPAVGRDGHHSRQGTSGHAVLPARLRLHHARDRSA